MNPNGLKNELVQRLYAHRYVVISVLQLDQSRMQDSDTPCAVCDDHSDTPENPMLFCDGYHVVGEEHSPVAYHAKCLDPPLGTLA